MKFKLYLLILPLLACLLLVSYTTDNKMNDGILENFPDNCLDSLVVPESFTPNGDDINDTYQINFLCPPEEMDFKIYNRWGTLIFETNDFEFHWNGEDQKGNPCEGGVYLWMLNYRFNGNEVDKKGNLVIMR